MYIGRIMTCSYRVYPVVSVDIIACFIVFSEVVVSACVVLSVVLLVTLVLTMCWCMDLYVCNKYNDIRFCHFSYKPKAITTTTTTTTTDSHEFIVLSSSERTNCTPDMTACLPLLYGPRSGSMA